MSICITGVVGFVGVNLARVLIDRGEQLIRDAGSSRGGERPGNRIIFYH